MSTARRLDPRAGVIFRTFLCYCPADIQKPVDNDLNRLQGEESAEGQGQIEATNLCTFFHKPDLELIHVRLQLLLKVIVKFRRAEYANQLQPIPRLVPLPD